METETVLPLFKEPALMNPSEAIAHLNYLRRTVRKRVAEREGVDQTLLSATQLADLIHTALSDYSMLHKLDRFEASIEGELRGML
jgi:hypothetical protein